VASSSCSTTSSDACPTPTDARVPTPPRIETAPQTVSPRSHGGTLSA
jgi:hypothetical protein